MPMVALDFGFKKAFFSFFPTPGNGFGGFPTWQPKRAKTHLNQKRPFTIPLGRIFHYSWALPLG